MKAFFKFILFVGLMSQQVSNAQNKTVAGWSVKYDYTKSFIENKGQFIIPASFGNTDPVLFAVDHGGTKIYFTKKGITYTLLQVSKKQKDQREMERERREELNSSPEEFARHEREENQLKTRADQVTMLWQNASNNVQIEASGLTSDYHNYSYKDESGTLKNLSYVKAYKKITYKNLYPNIDVEYVFAEKDGLKYSLILHPGADPTQVKMVYDSHVSLNNDGEIRISTRFGDIIDHAPLSFYQQNSSSIITSSFVKSGKTVSFQLTNYDNTKAVVIDPWTQTPAFAGNWDCVWECEQDGAGNAYLIGGTSPMQEKKYNSAGVLQWTYNTPYDTTAWLGTFAVDNAGNSYVTQGSAAKIVKVSTAGAVVWNNANPGGLNTLSELWCITFNCDQTKLIIGGTGGAGFPPSPKPYIYEINMANGNSVSNYQLAGGGFLGSEVRAIAPSGNGRYYFLSHDTLGAINQNFTSCPSSSPIPFKTTNSYNLSYKCENWRYNNTGIAALKANTSFVYTHRGDRLDKRSLATGAILASVAIPGGAFTSNQVQASGIDLDACGNIYVGSKNAVYKFDVGLNQLASYPTTYVVYDVHVTAGGNLVVGGSTGNSGNASRTGTLEYISAGACNTLSLTCCDANICRPPTKCTSDPAFNLSASTPGGTWSGTGITNATNGTFNPATAGVGTHVVTYSLACGSSTTTVTVSACIPLSVCNNGNGFTVSGGTGPYDWQSGTTSSGGGVSWTTYATNTISVGTPTSYPIRVLDAAGGTFSISSATAVPNCTNSPCPTLTMSITSQLNVNCFGASTGSASISTAGGTSPYTYTWSPGNLAGASQTGLSAGVYNISIKDGTLCAGTGTVTITQPTAAVGAVISATAATGCGASTGGATVTASGGTPGYTYSWTPSGGTTAGVSNLGAGNNSVTVTDSKGCTKTVVANITTAGGPTLSVVSQTNVNCYGANTGTATVSASGGTGPYSYTWSPGNLTGASQSSLSAGTYTINVKDNNLCVGSGTVLITQPTASLSGVISNTVAPGCGLTNGSASVTASGGTPGYTYSWTPNGGSSSSASNLSSGTNAVTITDSKGCTSTINVSLSSIGGPTLSVVSQTNVNCYGGNTGTATVNGSGGSGGPYTYTWSPGNLTGASQTSLSAGIYTITVADAGQCAGTGTLAITQPTAPVSANITNNPTGCGTSVGSATVAPSGGTPTYTYSWSPSGGTGATASNLSAGNYSVTVTDSKGCQTTSVTTIGSGGGGPTLSIASQTNITCVVGSTGSASISATGSAGPFSYTWSPTGGNAASASGLSAGIYTVTVKDGPICSSTITVNITQQPPLVLSFSTTPASCGNYDGTAIVSATGGTAPLSILWNINSTNDSIIGLAAGTYSVLVTDASGCRASGITQVNSAGSLTVAVGTSATIHPGESAPLIAYIPTGANVIWTPTTALSCSTCSNPIASPSVTTKYCAITTIGTCIDTACVLITVEIDCASHADYSAPTAFSPNGDGINDEFCLQGWDECITSFYIGIYNRWGEKVYSSEDVGFCWDGKFMGNPLNAAVFVYYIKATIKDAGDITKKGNITLVK